MTPEFLSCVIFLSNRAGSDFTSSIKSILLLKFGKYGVPARVNRVSRLAIIDFPVEYYYNLILVFWLFYLFNSDIPCSNFSLKWKWAGKDGVNIPIVKSLFCNLGFIVSIINYIKRAAYL